MIRSLTLAALICAVCIEQASASGEVGCFDEDGTPVDWYMGYKFPKIKGKGKFDTGYVYSYITSKDVAEEPNYDMQSGRPVNDYDSITFLRHFKDLLEKFGGPFRRPAHQQAKTTGTKSRQSDKTTRWVTSSKLITDPNSVVMKTLDPAYRKDLFDHISSVFYNDDPDHTLPEVQNDGNNDDEEGEGNARRKRSKPTHVAHAKGVLLMDEESNTGVWLTHSIPRFPNVRDHHSEYPTNGRLFGQTFMCITFDLKKYGSNLADHLINMRPLVYDRRFTPSILREIPQLSMLNLYEETLYQKTPKPEKLKQMITTKGGQALKLYSKSSSFQQDLYGGWIDEDLGADLYVETWRRGSGTPLESFCPADEHHINNVADLKFNSEVQWSYMNDHSKWAISDEQDIATVCIGDANRMKSQFRRGSGAICIKCPTCWTLFSNTIADTEPCPVKVNKGGRQNRRVDKSLARRIDDYLRAAGHE